MTPPDGASATVLALTASASLTEREIGLLEEMQASRLTFSTRDTVIREGDHLEDCYFVRDGWLGRRRSTVDGERVMTNIYLPGDVFAVQVGFRRRALFDVVALTDCELALVPWEELDKVLANSPRIEAALDWNLVRAFNIVSEHIVGVTTRYASERILHLFLEHWCRLMVVGKADDSSFHLPLKQYEIGEITGITSVSVSKSIRLLREEGLITFKGGVVRFLDFERCFSYCDFDPGFLEMFQPRGNVDILEITQKISD